MRHYLNAVPLAAGLAAVLLAGPALAGSRESAAAIERAQAKIELVSRSSGQPGMPGDQSFDQARQRLQEARDADKSGNHDRAEMRADEAGLLAELTGERAKLAGLMANQAAAAATLRPLQ